MAGLLDSSSPVEGSIIDAGGSRLHLSFRPLVLQGLCPSDPFISRVLYSGLMWDDTGLDLWRQLSCNPNYNQMWEELALMEEHIEQIAKHFENRGAIVDLGSGTAQKAMKLLSVLDRMGKSMDYYALDLSQKTLEDVMNQLSRQRYKNIRCYALWGNFDDAHEWIFQFRTGVKEKRPFYFCSFGSQFGNDYFEHEVSRFRKWSTLFHRHDRFLVGMDGATNMAKIWNSYHDADGLFDKYIRNGFVNSNRVLKQEWYQDAQWDITGEILTNPTMHRFVLTARADVEFFPELGSGIESVETTSDEGARYELEFYSSRIKKGEKIHAYEAFKSGPELMNKQFEAAGYRLLETWKSSNASYYQYLLSHENIEDSNLSVQLE